MKNHLNRRLESLQGNLQMMLDLRDDSETDNELKKELSIRIDIQTGKIQDTEYRISLLKHKTVLA